MSKVRQAVILMQEAKISTSLEEKNILIEKAEKILLDILSKNQDKKPIKQKSKPKSDREETIISEDAVKSYLEKVITNETDCTCDRCTVARKYKIKRFFGDRVSRWHQ